MPTPKPWSSAPAPPGASPWRSGPASRTASRSGWHSRRPSSVRDDSGKPIAGARVTLGYGAGMMSESQLLASLSRTTDARGHYRFEHVGAGQTVVTVQSSGHAPKVLQVEARQGMPPAEFKLG